MRVSSKKYQSLALAIGIWVGIALAQELEYRALVIIPILVVLRDRSFAPLLIAVLTGALVLLIHLESIKSDGITKFLDAEVKIEGVVSSDPSITKPRVVGSRLTISKITFLMRVESITSNLESYRLRTPIRVLGELKEPIFPGQRIELRGTFVATSERKVSALFFSKPDSLTLVSTPSTLRLLEKIRIQLRKVTEKLGGQAPALIPGMVIGDTSLQSPALSKLMLEAGLSHLTAVSGANFAIVSAFIFALIGMFVPSRRIQVIITIFTLVIFVMLVRPTPSVLRAGLMAAVFLVAKLSGRRSLGLNSLAVAIAVLLLINPFQAFEAGFILSVLATSGLLFLAPRISADIPGPKVLGDLVSIPTASTIFCAPYLMIISGGLNMGTILLNILVAPVVPFVTVLGFIATLLVVPLEGIAEVLIGIASYGAYWIILVASWSRWMPSLLTSAPLLILLIIIFTVGKVIRSWIAFLLIAILVVFSSSQKLSFPGANWQVGQCDVGQGDALLVNLGKGSAILFDAGPDPKLLERCLDQFKIRYLPLVVISHAHADHYQGLAATSKFKVGEIWSNRETNFVKGIPARQVRSGLRSKIGRAKVGIIWPKTGVESFDSISGDGSGENNLSVVAEVEIEGVRILVTGDIEPGAQRELLEGLSDIDLIKVPHHGSRFQELELFSGASLFLISVGANSYGHPDLGLISSLEQMGKVYRSDLDGPIAIGWHIDKSAEPIFSARLLGKEWWRISWH